MLAPVEYVQMIVIFCTPVTIYLRVFVLKDVFVINNIEPVRDKTNNLGL